MQIFVARNKQQTGPFNEEQILQMVSSGMLSPADLAWHEELAGWLPLNQVVSLGPAPPQFVPSAAPEMGAGPRGVGGWLLVFCAIATILGPLLSLPTLPGFWAYSNPALTQFPSLQTTRVLTASGSAALAICGVVAGCIIWMGSPRGKSAARAYLIFSLVVQIVLSCLWLGWLRSGEPNLEQNLLTPMFSLIGVYVVWSVVYFLIWWLYFLKSKRVRNTYG